MATKTQEILFKLKGTSKHLKRTLAGVERKFQGLKNRTKGIANAFRGLDYATVRGAEGIARAFARVGRAGWELVNESKDVQKTFNQAMMKMVDSTDLEPLNKQMVSHAKMQKRMSDVAKESSFMNIDIAQAMHTAAQAGRTTAETYDLIGNAAKFAEATNYGLNDSMGALMTTMATFDIPSNKTGKAAAQMARAVNTAYLNMEQLREAMKYVAPTAVGAGFGFEETLSTIQMMGDIGVHGSQAGTAAKRIFLAAGGAATGAAKHYIAAIKKHMKSEGIKFTMPNFTKALIESMRNMTRDQKVAKITELFGQRAVVGMMKVAFAPKTLEKMYERIADLNETNMEYLNRSRTSMRKHGVKELEIMKSTWDNFKITFGRSLLQASGPSFEKITKFLSEMTDALEKKKNIRELKQIVSEILQIVMLTVDALRMMLEVYKGFRTFSKGFYNVTKGPVEGVFNTGYAGAAKWGAGKIFDGIKYLTSPEDDLKKEREMDEKKQNRYQYLLDIKGLPSESILRTPERPPDNFDIGMEFAN